MARADLLLALVRTSVQGDDQGFQRAAEALIADEKAKRHGVLAEQLSNALLAQPRRREITASASARPNYDGLVHEILPERALSELVLPDHVTASVKQLIEEHHRRDLLRSYGVEPRHRVLLVGPPGGGKTTLAEALATELGTVLLSVRYEGIIGSFLGETAGRMDSLFELVRATPCVLFFDEFDAVAKERGDVHETGEIKRVVSSLLQQIDRLPSHVVVVAATNHPELLDRAVWRRMQLRLELPKPTREMRITWIERWARRKQIDFGLASRTLADRLRGLSLAEIEQFALDVERRQILDGPTSNPRTITQMVLQQLAFSVSGSESD